MSRAEVDALRAMLASRPAGLPLAARRAGFEAMAAAQPLPAGMREAAADGIAARWVWVEGASADHAVLWLHGGAFTVGSSGSYRAFAARLSAACGARVLLPDYRLVPEHPFPAPLDDAGAALNWLARGIAHVAIGGDSAGGNLAAAAVQARLDAGLSPPVAAWLLSPYLDLTHSGASIAARAARDPFVDAATMPHVAAAYHAETDPVDPRVSPLFGTVAGFPPALIQVGEDEALFDDALRFAGRLRAAGGDPVFQEWVGMIHVWPFFADRVEEGRWAIAQAGAFLRRHLFLG